MHATCEFNNTATTATTTTSAVTAAAAAADLNNSEQQILIHSIEHNNCNSNSINNHNHNLYNVSEQNGHTRSGSNDDLFMSASSSTMDFCGKVTTPTAAKTIHVLTGASNYLGEKLTVISGSNNHILETTTDKNCKSPKKTCSITPVQDLVTATTPIRSSNFSNASESSISAIVNSNKNISCSSSSSINLNNKCSSLVVQSPPSEATILKTTPGQKVPPIVDKTSESASLLQRVEFEDLLQWKDMPRHLQFNPYVLTGYRPLSSVRGCFFSLFYWHNETINILTHGIPIVYILAIVPSLMPWEKDFRFLSFCHIFGAVAPWCGSFIYHLFMNLERGENVYYRLLKIDMVGIWISQSFGALPMVTASVYCFGFKIKWLMIIGYCILSLWGLYKALNASSPWQRRLCFALPFTMRVFLTFFRTLRWAGGNPHALTHVYLQDMVSVFGGAIGAMHIPEKWFPGSVDLYLNSHNIMHVLVVVAVYSMHKATVSDFEWMSKIECNNFYNSSVTIENSMNEHFEL